MDITITLTHWPLSPEEATVLKAVTDVLAPKGETEAPKANGVAKPAPKAPAAKPKPEPKPEPEPEPKPEPEPEPEPEEAPEAPEDDVLGDEMTPEQARDEATARAQKLVGEGKSSAVRAALDSVKKGAKVSTLSDTEVFAFLKALG